MAAKVLVIPRLPVSKNVWQRCHWAKRNRIKQTWHAFVWGLVNEAPRMPRPLPQVKCRVVVYWDKGGPLPDWHNLHMAHECIADGLVRAGILADDSNGQYLEDGVGVVKAPKGEGRTEAFLTWAENPG